MKKTKWHASFESHPLVHGIHDLMFNNGSTISFSSKSETEKNTGTFFNRDTKTWEIYNRRLTGRCATKSVKPTPTQHQHNTNTPSAVKKPSRKESFTLW